MADLAQVADLTHRVGVVGGGMNELFTFSKNLDI